MLTLGSLGREALLAEGPRWPFHPSEDRMQVGAYLRHSRDVRLLSEVKANGGLAAEFCRARGLGAHHLAVLAAAVVHYLKLAMTDPLADNHDESDDDYPNGTDDGSEGTADNDGISDVERAPTQSATLTRPERSF